MKLFQKLKDRIELEKGKRENIFQKQYNGKPFIVFDRESNVNVKTIYPNHYCKEELYKLLIAYCRKHRLDYTNHGKLPKTYADGSTKEWQYISISHNGRYITGQCFHRIITTVMRENNVPLSPRYSKK